MLKRHALVRIFIALTAFDLAASLAALSALAQTPDVSAGQETDASQDQAPESVRRNNGFDLTRPQNAFEVRGLATTSSNDTSKTDKANLLLRVESKIPLDPNWRLGLLAVIPFVGKTTIDFNPSSVTHEFGLGDTEFQVVVAHALDERWAVGVGARVSAETSAGRQDRGAAKLASPIRRFF
jgi:long-subunit fatty acid transport protein